MAARLKFLPAALAVLLLSACVLGFCFSPRGMLSVLSYPQADDSFQVLGIGADGRYISGGVRSEEDLIALLSGHACVRVLQAAPKPGPGEICLFYGDMCALIGPDRAMVYTAGSTENRYAVVQTDSSLYPQVRRLLDLEGV